ncbi:MAG TPA: HD domain-containing phosphohydrolase [Dehalococcoidia bacterium]|nr:HD domain-containing phosphohydrolase [Dehalococcoidia bacterium]
MRAIDSMTALDARRQQQVPQTFARVAVIMLFMGLWLVLWAARIPMPVPFLITLLAEAAFFLAYWRAIFILPSVRAITWAHYFMLGAEICFHTTMVYFLGGITWLGAFAYVFGLIFANTFLSLRGGLVYTTAVVSALLALAILDGTGVIPHYEFLAQDALRYKDGRFVVTTLICGAGVFYSVYVWINWVGAQLRVERDAAVAMRDDLFEARAALERANAELEERVRERTSELVTANASLGERDELLRATIESTADGILVVDAAGNVAYHNERFLSMWRIPADVAATGDDDALLASVLDQLDDPEAFLAKVRDLYRSSAEDLDLLHFKDGRVFERYSRPLLRDGEVAGRVWSFRDVTARENATADLRRRARIDALTSTLNHGAITEELSALVQSAPGRRLAVVMADVDAMKTMNDAYGHQAGDEMLLAVARALEIDNAIVGRYGGDEFIALLPGAARGDAEAYCARVAESLRTAQVRDAATGSLVPVEVSMGIAVYPDEAASADELLRSADAAMYAAKRDRRMAGASALTRAVHGDERAARIVGEIVPVLTLPGDLEAKLRLVANRLSTVAGYEIVRFNLMDGHTRGRSTYARIDERYVQQFDNAVRSEPEGSLTRIVAATGRPVVIEDLTVDERLPPGRRAVLRQAGIHSALVVPMIWEDRLIGVMSVATKEKAAFGPRDIQLVTAVADQVTAIIRMERLVGDLQDTSSHLQRARADTVVLLAASAEAHDATTGRHLQRVRAITEALARELGYDDEGADALGLAAVLHDIGKIRVPDAILLSPAQLSDDEWSIMKLHTTWGAEFLRDRPGFELAATIAAAHHERWDGSGYPRGLAGEQIPEAATIVAVADSLDAMTHDRPYRAGRPLDWAVEEVRAGAGTQFNPRVVDALLRIHARGELARYRYRHDGDARAA